MDNPLGGSSCPLFLHRIRIWYLGHLEIGAHRTVTEDHEVRKLGLSTTTGAIFC